MSANFDFRIVDRMQALGTHIQKSQLRYHNKRVLVSKSLRLTPRTICTPTKANAKLARPHVPRRVRDQRLPG